MPDPPRSWFEFWVRFSFGAIFGFVLSGLVWVRWFCLWRTDFSWLMVSASTFVCALAAARYGDRFWASFRTPGWWQWD
jgi:hypothetical protein